MPFENIETVYDRLKETYVALNKDHYITHSFDDVEREYNSRYKNDITLYRDDQIVLRYHKGLREFFLETTFSNQVINGDYINKVSHFYDVLMEANTDIKVLPYS